MAPPPHPPAQQSKEIRKSPRTSREEAVARREARYEQASLEYAEHKKRAAARKKSNVKPGLDPKEALGTVTKKEHVNAATKRKRKPQPGKPTKRRAKKGTRNMEFDLLDDDGGDNDDDDDDVKGNKDGDDGDKIVRKRKPKPGKANKKRAKKGTRNVEFNLLDDNRIDDDDDDVGGINEDGNDGA